MLTTILNFLKCLLTKNAISRNTHEIQLFKWSTYVARFVVSVQVLLHQRRIQAEKRETFFSTAGSSLLIIN